MARVLRTGREAEDGEPDTDLGAELRGAGDEQRQQQEERAGAAGPHLAGPDLCLGENKAVRLLPSVSSPLVREAGAQPAAREGRGRECSAVLSGRGLWRLRPPASTVRRGGGGAGPRAWEKEGPPDQECAWSAPSPGPGGGATPGRGWRESPGNPGEGSLARPQTSAGPPDQPRDSWGD